MRGKNKFWDIPIPKLTLFPFLLRRDWFLKDRLFNNSFEFRFHNKKTKTSWDLFIKLNEFKISLITWNVWNRSISCFELKSTDTNLLDPFDAVLLMEVLLRLDIFIKIVLRLWMER